MAECILCSNQTSKPFNLCCDECNKKNREKHNDEQKQIKSALKLQTLIKTRIVIIKNGINQPFPDNVIPLRDENELLLLEELVKESENEHSDV